MTSGDRTPGLSAYYGGSIGDFLAESVDALIGKLTQASRLFSVDPSQTSAWTKSIEVLKDALRGYQGHVLLEFDIPRLGSRVDAVVLSNGMIFPIEFKVGEKQFNRDAIDQAWDYALDLKNFHSASHDRVILPILVATEAHGNERPWGRPHPDRVHPPACTRGDGLRGLFDQARSMYPGLPPIEGLIWGSSAYRPTPTIVEAARALYSEHSVEAISRSDAGARNLAVTSRRVEEIIENARRSRSKAIVFVTGVPGAGKTLVGLNIATQSRDEGSPTHAVFLSGNGPLVKVLREALVRDDVSRRKIAGEANVRKGDSEQRVKPFIQNVHHFRDDGLRDETAPPSDRVVIFDEAQRAWNLQQTAAFMKRKKGRPDFEYSEPEFLVGYLDRHEDWAVIVCLVGGGQEINTGEAGISEWLDAIEARYTHWQIHISPRLTSSEYDAEESIRRTARVAAVRRDEALHLSVSMRSFRAERVSEFVRALLDRDEDEARSLLSSIAAQYPIVITRELDRAKKWIRDHARGSERYGLVASSQAMRLKPHAIDIRVSVDPVHYFLNNRKDTRSSWYLEDAATEFQVQGLELDWACMTWDADLRLTEDGWSHHEFRGVKWQNINAAARQKYLLNAYRVLLTRARQGMAIFIPPGDSSDPTRKPSYYDPTFNYLRDLGLQVI